MNLLSIEKAQIINVFFVYATLKIFFHVGFGPYDALFAVVLITRAAAEVKEFGDSGLLTATGFLSAFLSLVLAVEGGFVRPAVVTFMALALTGNAFLYLDLETTWAPFAGLACFAAAAFILAQPDGKEDERHAKNRVWALGFFAVQALGATYVSYRSYRERLVLSDQLVAAMLTRFFILVVCLTKTFDVVEDTV